MFKLPTGKGEIAALCAPVLQGRMARIQQCGSFSDEQSAAQAIEATLVHESQRTIIYHAEHFASFCHAMRRRLGISDQMALALRGSDKKEVYSGRARRSTGAVRTSEEEYVMVPEYTGTYCFCLRNIVEIDFHGMELLESQGVLLAELVPDRVTDIRLDGCGLGVPTATALAATVRRARQLRSVNVARKTDGFPIDVESLRADRQLTLDFSSNLMLDADAIVMLAALPDPSQATSLNLSVNSLSAMAATHLAAALPKLAALTSLDMSKNFLGDEGLLSLVGAKAEPADGGCPLPPTLQTLILRDNNIGGEGAEALVERLADGSLPCVVEVDLSYNWIDASAGCAIAKCTNCFPDCLGALRLFKNQVTKPPAHVLGSPCLHQTFT